MFFKIIISLGLIFLVDYTLGNCGLCLENHIACHSEDTFSLCVEGKPTDSLVRCPKDLICTNDPDVCVKKSKDELKPSCITKNVPENFGNSYKTQNVVSLKLTEDGINRALSDEETDTPPSSTEGEEEGNSPSTQYPDISTVDPIVPAVSEDPSTDYPEGETVSSVDDSDSSTDTTLTDEGITLITENLSSTTEVTESVELSTSSTEDMSTTDLESLSSTSTPRDATTFCSEIENVGTYKADGDNTCKRYYVCTTNGDGFKGYEFNCGEKYYFNSETGYCQEEKPDDC